MFKILAKATSVFVFTCLGHLALASSWALDNDSSKLAFGSIKKDTIGEVHSFENLNGFVSEQGEVTIEIDLGSVQTNIDIRNERMVEHVFKNAPTAQLTANIDPNEIEAIEVGGNAVIDVEGALSFLGANIDVETEMFVARLSETQVLVSTNDMIFLGVEDAGIMAGIDKLMELAKLPGITRTSPVTMRLIFNLNEQKAEAAPAAPVAPIVEVLGDSKAGKKVFKKCKACHSVKEGKNGVGPSLFNVVNKQAGSVDGFKYSKNMAQSGLTWNGETLSAFLADPKSTVPGNKMAFRGLKKQEDINNLIAYLAEN